MEHKGFGELLKALSGGCSQRGCCRAAVEGLLGLSRAAPCTQCPCRDARAVLLQPHSRCQEQPAVPAGAAAVVSAVWNPLVTWVCSVQHMSVCCRGNSSSVWQLRLGRAAADLPLVPASTQLTSEAAGAKPVSGMSWQSLQREASAGLGLCTQSASAGAHLWCWVQGELPLQALRRLPEHCSALQAAEAVYKVGSWCWSWDGVCTPPACCCFAAAEGLQRLLPCLLLMVIKQWRAPGTRPGSISPMEEVPCWR